MIKNIFGYKVEISSEIKELNIEKSLSFYNDDTSKTEKKLKINIKDNYDAKSFGYKSSNPKIIKVNEKGFSMKFQVMIFWDLENLKENQLTVDIYLLERQKSMFKKSISKFLSMGFEKVTDIMDQILHELVLVPSTFFFQDKVIIHGSCLYNKKYDKSVVFGGTGGVGKTSSLIEMGKDHDWVFLSDDIVVVDESGKIYPNYAYPKIYAYNTIGDKNFEKEILKNKSFMNKFQWRFWKKINPARVRRRISPSLLYNSEFVSPKLDENLFLFRGNFDEDISFEKKDAKSSSDFEKNIILTEYESIYKFIKWYEYNAKALGFEPHITFDEIVKNYEEKYNKIFSNTNNYIVKIDDSMSHNLFKKEMIKQTEQLIKE